MSTSLSNYMFPKARLDEMNSESAKFDRRVPPAAQWRFDGQGNFDAAESAFVARQLEFMRPGVIEASFPEFKGAQVVPWNTQPDNGSEQYTVTFMDQVGEVKVSRDMTGVAPRADMKTSQDSIPIFSLVSSYGYSVQDARAAIKAGVALVPHRAMLCREIMERKLDSICFIGDTGAGCKGLLNLTTAQAYAAANGASGSKLWSTKTPDEILLDLNGAPSAIVSATLEIEVPDTMLMPLSRREYIYGRRVGDGTSESIASYFLKNTAHIKSLIATHKSETAGASNTARVVTYQRNPAKLEMIVPQTFEQLQPFANGVEVVTTCHIRTAGVYLYRPQSLSYMDGI